MSQFIVYSSQFTEIDLYNCTWIIALATSCLDLSRDSMLYKPRDTDESSAMAAAGSASELYVLLSSP